MKDPNDNLILAVLLIGLGCSMLIFASDFINQFFSFILEQS